MKGGSYYDCLVERARETEPAHGIGQSGFGSGSRPPIDGGNHRACILAIHDETVSERSDRISEASVRPRDSLGPSRKAWNPVALYQEPLCFRAEVDRKSNRSEDNRKVTKRRKAVKFWSEGLGTRDLIMGLDGATVSREEDAVILTGVVEAPADWAYKVTIEAEDWNTILRTATSPQACDFLSRSLRIGTLVVMGWLVSRFLLSLSRTRWVRVFSGLRGTNLKSRKRVKGKQRQAEDRIC